MVCRQEFNPQNPYLKNNNKKPETVAQLVSQSWGWRWDGDRQIPGKTVSQPSLTDESQDQKDYVSKIKVDST